MPHGIAGVSVPRETGEVKGVVPRPCLRRFPRFLRFLRDLYEDEAAFQAYEGCYIKMYLHTNIIARIHIVGEMYLNLPATARQMT